MKDKDHVLTTRDVEIMGIEEETIQQIKGLDSLFSRRGGPTDIKLILEAKMFACVSLKVLDELKTKPPKKRFGIVGVNSGGLEDSIMPDDVQEV